MNQNEAADLARKIEQWRLEDSLLRTFLKRPDLLEARSISDEEEKILRKWSHRIERIIHDRALHRSDALSGEE